MTEQNRMRLGTDLAEEHSSLFILKNIVDFELQE